MLHIHKTQQTLHREDREKVEELRSAASDYRPRYGWASAAAKMKEACEVIQNSTSPYWPDGLLEKLLAEWKDDTARAAAKTEKQAEEAAQAEREQRPIVQAAWTAYLHSTEDNPGVPTFPRGKFWLAFEKEDAKEDGLKMATEDACNRARGGADIYRAIVAERRDAMNQRMEQTEKQNEKRRAGEWKMTGQA